MHRLHVRCIPPHVHGPTAAAPVTGRCCFHEQRPGTAARLSSASSGSSRPRHQAPANLYVASASTPIAVAVNSLGHCHAVPAGCPYPPHRTQHQLKQRNVKLIRRPLFRRSAGPSRNSSCVCVSWHLRAETPQKRHRVRGVPLSVHSRPQRGGRAHAHSNVVTFPRNHAFGAACWDPSGKFQDLGLKSNFSKNSQEFLEL